MGAPQWRYTLGMGSYERDAAFARRLLRRLGTEEAITTQTVGIMDREAGATAIMCAGHALGVFCDVLTWESALAKCEKAIEQREKEATWN